MAPPEKQQQKKQLVFAYYVTGHGLGHATRVVEVTRQLVKMGHVVHVVTGAPDYVFTREIQSPHLHVRKVLLDCGAIQSDALTVDRRASLEKYTDTAVAPREGLLATEVAWLRSVGVNLVVSDIVPVACRAAFEAGVPSVCVSNFSWDFIYSDYVAAAGYQYRPLVLQIAEDYSRALMLLRLPGHCPMPAFRDVIDVPLIVRPVHKSREQVRRELGLPADEKLLLFNFGGQDASWQLREEFLPPGWRGVVCTALGVGELPPNFIRPDRDVYTPDLIAACDCMLGKIGYGTTSEALAYKVPFVFVRRDYFNEEPFLRSVLEFHRCGVEMQRKDFFAGRWGAYLDRALQMRPNYDSPTNGGEVAARALEAAAMGKRDALPHASGSDRLRDAIVFGYHMQRAPGRTDIDVPVWYTARAGEGGEEAVSPRPAPLSTDFARSESAALEDSFEVLEGATQGLEDTRAFLRVLARLDEDGSVAASDKAEKPQARERLAAAGLFRWEDEVFVARAPGRLDVMGGIADYSGSLVLQMPIREACHVALQRSPPAVQRQWKHTLARHSSNGSVGTNPSLRIVSFGADATNRAPTFDMDMSEFLDTAGEPISYEAARKFFDQDSSQKWAAYVAGAVLVLMRERGVRFPDGLSILVSSAVPEGKGVSSSAAIEVATMSALAAAHGIKIEARDLALLCQMVENQVVGAPCGVMDQMASACGRANQLMAMVCQPAEIRAHVPIPPHVQLWGLDSGIKHSVGGADYGSVRVGAFMGRRIIQALCAADKPANVSSEPASETPLGDLASPVRSRAPDADVEYLCSIPPHRFHALYAPSLPETLTGAAFLRAYESHGDSATSVERERAYAVRQPACHPVEENFRVRAFAQMLAGAPDAQDEQLQVLGELMYQSHESYSRCGLGSGGTDRLVTMVREAGAGAGAGEGGEGRPGLYGAKITGGGSGGTVCVLGRACAGTEAEVMEIRSRYRKTTGHLPYVFRGSSPGAAQFGFLRLRRILEGEQKAKRAKAGGE